MYYLCKCGIITSSATEGKHHRWCCWLTTQLFSVYSPCSFLHPQYLLLLLYIYQTLRFSCKCPNASTIYPFLHLHKCTISVVGDGQSRSLRHPQPARLLWVWKPEGHAAGQTALPLATACHSHTSFQRRVHLTEKNCESTRTELC